MKKQEPRVSIIIPIEEVNDYLRESLTHLANLDYPDFEVLVFITKETKEEFPRTRFIVDPELARRPAEKRDLALKYAKGEILAFIDDDAYPESCWLKNAVGYFKDPETAAVCGPGVTPPNDSVLQKASGWVSASLLGGGPQAFYRFLAREKREVDDYPSMNFIVRKSDFGVVGGFDSRFWPGEDTHFTLNLTKNLDKKIIYDPQVLVFHHRRPLFIPHLKQNGRYGLHRGYFARVLPETSRRLSYFIPSLFTLFLFLELPLAFFLKNQISLGSSSQFSNAVALAGLARVASSTTSLLWNLSGFLVLLYVLLLILSGFWVFSKERNLKVASLVIPGIFLTHIWYGLRFIQGFLSKELEH